MIRLFILILTFFLINEYPCSGQVKTDSLITDSLITDSIKTGTLTMDSLKIDSNKAGLYYPDSVYNDSVRENEKIKSKMYEVILNKLLKQNKLASFNTPPVSFISTKKQAQGKEHLFYLLGGLLLLFGFFKVFYVKYFNNIFRVFFNTSLRQNQLTDLLLQARLPSLIFNIFFTITGGGYLWFILQYYQLIPHRNMAYLLACVIITALIYTIKFLVLKFLGWVTGMVEAFNTYIFVVFLINKILGIILMPFLIILAFSSEEWSDNVIILSLLILGIFFLLRFFRSYNLLQHQLEIKGLHFFLYLLSIEILPVFLIFKTLVKMSSFTVK